MKNASKLQILTGIFLSIYTQSVTYGQTPSPAPAPAGVPLWTIQGQVRPRGELRHGLGNPYPKSANTPAGFISQRTNLGVGFRWDKLAFQLDLRDVRVWGQDAAQINNADGNKLYVHQAWGEFTLATAADTTSKFQLLDNISLKVGRQELVYDDVRLLGNLDWLQQGRRHDAAILRVNHRGYFFDLGGAFNQNTDAFGTVGINYTPNNTGTFITNRGFLVSPGANFVQTNTYGGAPTNIVGPGPSTNAQNQMYKSMAFLYATKKFSQTKVSLLAFNDNFSKWRLDSTRYRTVNTSVTPGGDTSTSVTDLGSIYGRRYDQGGKVNSRFTVGGQIQTQFGNASEGGKLLVNAGGYYQVGHNTASKYLQAYHGFAYGTYSIGQWSFGPGYEILSGNTTNTTGANTALVGSQDNRFDPLYGTPHRWWGYMDYFYVGTGGPSAGLQDIYFRVRHDRKNFFATLDVHQFMTAFKDVNYRANAAAPWQKLGATYGQEVDLLLNYQANKFTNIEFGYSFFVATPTLGAVKNIAKDSYDSFNQWAYLQLNIRPDFLFQKPIAIKQ